MTQHLNDLEENLNKYQVETNLAAPNNIKDELRNGIQMVRLGTEIRHFGQTKAALSSQERINYLEKMQQRLTTIQEEHRRLWLQRNKSGGLERSSKPFDNLAQQISTMLTTERGSDFGKSVNALQEKVLTGGVNWYLN